MSESIEQRARRRRWLTLAEVLAVAGVVIAGLTLWNNWSERDVAQQEKAAAAAGEARSRARLSLAATVGDGGDRLMLSGGDHELADVTVTLPRPLGVSPKRPATPAVEADWFREPLLKLTDGGSDEREGVLPVLIQARYWDGETARTVTAVYDLIWRTKGRVLRGRSLRLEGMRLRDRRGTAAALDAAWKREKPQA